MDLTAEAYMIALIRSRSSLVEGHRVFLQSFMPWDISKNPLLDVSMLNFFNTWSDSIQWAALSISIDLDS